MKLERDVRVGELRCIRDLVADRADRYGDKSAFLQWENGRLMSYSYRRYRSEAEALGTALLGRGLGGRRVLLAGGNGYEWVLCYTAMVSGVGEVIPVDKTLDAAAVVHIAKKVQAAAVLCSDEVAQRLLAHGAHVDVIAFSSLPELIAEGRLAIHGGAEPLLSRELDEDSPAALYAVADNARWAVLSNRNLVFGASRSAALLEVDDRDVFFSVLPLHSTYESVLGFLMPVFLGATVVFGTDLSRLREELDETGPTVAIVVPALLSRLYDRLCEELVPSGGAKTASRAKSGRLGASAVVIAAKKRLFAPAHRLLGSKMRLFVCVGPKAEPHVLSGMNALGFRAVQGYGMAESASLMTVCPPRAAKHGSVGVCLSDAILDVYNRREDGMGEIRYKGDNVMIGYDGQPELTAEVKRDGWLYTGDIGYVDGEGYLYVVGRKANEIVTAAGKRISPEEIESILIQDPAVKEAAVIGILNHQKRDYDLIAFIHPNYETIRQTHGENFTFSDVHQQISHIFDAVNQTLPLYKRLTSYQITESPLPKTPTQKLDRLRIVELSKK